MSEETFVKSSSLGALCLGALFLESHCKFHLTRRKVDKEDFLRKTGLLVRLGFLITEQKLVRFSSLFTLSTLSCPNPTVKNLPL
ncbi:MAG: hypothetical protein F6K14_04780 [Symploca sp. SIO2C1]|nr:hypothetical protein [Symploca sp. SIO2C1]